jgi:hypothetical protein
MPQRIEHDRQAPSKKARKNVRFTYLLPEILYRNLETYCFSRGLSRQQVISDALTDFLRKNGMQPEKEPHVSFKYDAE